MKLLKIKILATFKSLIIVIVVLNNCKFSVGQRNKRDDDSYLSAYKQTHNLNDHQGSASSLSNLPSANVVYVDANQPENVYPVYVQNQLDESNPHPAIDHTFHQVDVEHHYPAEYHSHYQDVSVDHNPPSGLGNYAGESSYLPPSNSAGYPAAPVPTYGPPIPIYPPKKPSFVYGPPNHKPPPLINHGYYEHHEEPSIVPKFLTELITPDLFLSIFEKIKWFKLDLFTIGKLILKFFIFKKILIFLTILFLLLVIPSLKHKGKESVGMMSEMVDKFGDDDDEEEDDEERRRRSARMLKINKNHINNLTSHVLSSIESFEQKFDSDMKRNQPIIVASDLQIGDNKSDYSKSQSIIEKIKTMIPSRE